MHRENTFLFVLMIQGATVLRDCVVRGLSFISVTDDLKKVLTQFLTFLRGTCFNPKDTQMLTEAQLPSVLVTALFAVASFSKEFVYSSEMWSAWVCSIFEHGCLRASGGFKSFGAKKNGRETERERTERGKKGKDT